MQKKKKKRLLLKRAVMEWNGVKSFKILQMRAVQRGTVIAPPVRIMATAKVAQGEVCGPNSPRDSKSCPRVGSHLKSQERCLKL